MTHSTVPANARPLREQDSESEMTLALPSPWTEVRGIRGQGMVVFPPGDIQHNSHPQRSRGKKITQDGSALILQQDHVKSNFSSLSKMFMA